MIVQILLAFMDSELSLRNTADCECGLRSIAFYASINVLEFTTAQNFVVAVVVYFCSGTCYNFFTILNYLEHNLVEKEL